MQLHDCSIVQCAEKLAAAACIPRDHVAEHSISLLSNIEVKGRPSLKLSEPIGLVDVGGDVRPCAV